MAEMKYLNEYQSARRLARRWLSDHAHDENEGYLPVLEQNLTGKNTVWEISLGTHDIPLSRIVGTYTSTRSNSFAGNFLPLLGEGTEFAQKWQNVYAYHMNEGISDPIKVYEYMNKFYVLEGNKRVSVMNFVEAYSIRADVIRFVPKRTEDAENIMYFELLDYDIRGLWFVDMEFSRPGSFSELIKLARKRTAGIPPFENTEPHEWLPQCFRPFMLEYHRQFSEPPIPAGEAFWEYVKVYGFPYRTFGSELEERIANCAPQFRLAAGEGKTTTVEAAPPSPPERRQGFNLFGFLSSKKPTALFVYRTSPEYSSWTRSHEAGRRAAEKFFDGQIETSAIYNVSTTDAYPVISDAISGKPDLLFTINSRFDHASLQIALENPDITVFNCNHSQAGSRLSTYFCKLYEQNFLLGVIAGSVTKSNILGYIDSPARTSKTTYSINAFALGAKLVNRNISVKRCQLDTNFSGLEDRHARALLHDRGADIVFCQYPTDSPINPKPGDNLYGMLCAVGRGGSVQEYLAAPAWNWEMVYRKIIGDWLDGTLNVLKKGENRGGGNVHFWFGLASGAIEVLKVDAALGNYTTRLARLFDEMIVANKLHPFRGPILDMEGNERIGPYDVPSLNDIQGMDWLIDIVDEVVSLNGE